MSIYNTDSLNPKVLSYTAMLLHILDDIGADEDTRSLSLYAFIIIASKVKKLRSFDNEMVCSIRLGIKNSTQYGSHTIKYLIETYKADITIVNYIERKYLVEILFGYKDSLIKYFTSITYQTSVYDDYNICRYNYTTNTCSCVYMKELRSSNRFTFITAFIEFLKYKHPEMCSFYHKVCYIINNVKLS